jgi:hypothetical protein
MPFFCVAFTGSKVPIEISRLPDRRLNRECCCNPSGTYALPHLHPIHHAVCTDFRSRKKMYVVGHENVVAHPPAVTIGRELPNFAQGLLAVGRSKNFASLISAFCKEDNRVVAERRYMRQVPKWSCVFWRRPALGPKKSPSARGRTGSMVALVSHNSELFGALILAPSCSRCERNSRANSTAPGVSP